MDIENLNININLLAFKNACVVPLKGKTGTKNCVVIPIEDNDIFLKLDENLKAKAAHLHLTAWKAREVGKYGDTHYIKQNLSQEFKCRVGAEECKNRPILGNGKPAQSKRQQSQDVPAEQPDDNFDINQLGQNDGLPF